MADNHVRRCPASLLTREMPNRRCKEIPPHAPGHGAVPRTPSAGEDGIGAAGCRGSGRSLEAVGSGVVASCAGPRGGSRAGGGGGQRAPAAPRRWPRAAPRGVVRGDPKPRAPEVVRSRTETRRAPCGPLHRAGPVAERRGRLSQRSVASGRPLPGSRTGSGHGHAELEGCQTDPRGWAGAACCRAWKGRGRWALAHVSVWVSAARHVHAGKLQWACT